MCERCDGTGMYIDGKTNTALFCLCPTGIKRRMETFHPKMKPIKVNQERDYKANAAGER